MRLYEIANEYQTTFDFLATAEDIPQEQFDAILDTWKCEFEDKAIEVAKFCKNLEAQANAINDAAEEMCLRAMRLQKKANNMRDYIQREMDKCKIKEIKKSPLFMITIRSNPPSVEVFNTEEIPDEFILKKEVTSINKNLIKDVIKEGIIVPGAHLVSKERLIIK